MVIIGFGHKARNGKDFCCEQIIKHFGNQYDIRKYAFADKVKEEVYYKLDNDLDPLWKQVVKPELPPKNTGLNVETPIEYIDRCKKYLRPALQYHGESTRVEKPFYWISQLNKKLSKDRPTVALISDVRHINEFQYIKSLSGYTVKVNRIGFSDPTINNEHLTETALINAKFDFEISCLDGDTESLRRDAIEVFNIIRDDLTEEFPTLEDLTICNYQVKAIN